MIFNCYWNGINFINIFIVCVVSGKKFWNIKEDLEKGLKEVIIVKMLLMNSWGEFLIKILWDIFICYLIILFVII